MLEDHVKTHEKLFKRTKLCKICLKKIPSNLVYVHDCNTLIWSSYHCEICNKTFTNLEHLNFHRSLHLHKSKALFCGLCKRWFDTEEFHMDHYYKTHSDKNYLYHEYRCEICQKIFESQRFLNKHKMVHDFPNFKCTFCQKGFESMNDLQEHEITHKSYQCHICGKTLTRLGRLRKHLLTHEAVPVLSNVIICKVCKICFPDEKTAGKHQETNHKEHYLEVVSTDRIFRCEYCEMCFLTRKHLNDHRTYHNDEAPFTCNICEAKFTTFARFVDYRARKMFGF